MGIDCFEPNAGTVENAICKACGRLMEIERDLPAVGGFAAAMSGSNRKRDRFTCPDSEHDWHLQVVALTVEVGKTNSAKLTALLQEEISEIVATKEPTKKVVGWF
jgi:hypothetical protein